MESFKKGEIPKLVISILIPLIVGFTSALATWGSINTLFNGLYDVFLFLLVILSQLIFIFI